MKTVLSRLAEFYFLVAVIITTGCAVQPIADKTQPKEMNLGPVRAVIEHGDWLVIRGVTDPDNFIGSVTNMPFSHSAIYDKDNDEVVEADSHGVHLTSLEKFLGKAARVWVVKPIWATRETRPLAVARARSRVGLPYNYSGLIGLGLPDSYYCSELVIDAWLPFMAGEKVNPIPKVISPGRLHHWGRVVYDSLEIGLGRAP